jgi:hypothetical protein
VCVISVLPTIQTFATELHPFAFMLETVEGRAEWGSLTRFVMMGDLQFTWSFQVPRLFFFSSSLPKCS